MTGFVKLRRGLLEHLRSGRLTETQFTVYVALIMLAHHKTGIWRGNVRSLAEETGLSLGAVWKALGYLDEKGYLAWERHQNRIRVNKYHAGNPPVENPVEDRLEKPRRLRSPVHHVNKMFTKRTKCSPRERPIRNRRSFTRSSSKKEHVATGVARNLQAASPSRGKESRQNPSQAPAPAPVDARISAPVRVARLNRPGGPSWTAQRSTATGERFTADDFRLAMREFRGIAREKSAEPRRMNDSDRRTLLEAQRRLLSGESSKPLRTARPLAEEGIAARRATLERQKQFLLAREAKRRPAPASEPPQANSGRGELRPEAAQATATRSSGRGELLQGGRAAVPLAPAPAVAPRRESRPERSPP